MKKADKFIETYRSFLIALAIALGLFNLYQEDESKQVRWVDGWTCSYWDAVKNENQGLIESELRSGAASSSLLTFTERRDEAADKFNENCLPDSAYLFKE